MAPKRHAHTLPLRIYEYALIWDKKLLQVKLKLSMRDDRRPPWVTQVDPKSEDRGPSKRQKRRKTEEQTETEVRRPREDGGRARSGAAANQGMPIATTRSQKGQQRMLL